MLFASLPSSDRPRAARCNPKYSTRMSRPPNVRQKKRLPDEIPCGCIFSNELLDAMPVHRVIRERDDLREIHVGLGRNGLCDEIRPLSSTALTVYFAEQQISLLQDQQAEINLAACRWIAEAGAKLKRGFVLSIDYGHEARELYDERHMRGTLLAYERHRASEDFFRAPGDQDLTAHVNFTALEINGRKSGLVRTGFTSQSKFLMALARHGEFADLQSDEMSETEQQQRRLLFKTLINPEGMGETFQVLIQHKESSRATLQDLNLSDGRPSRPFLQNRLVRIRISGLVRRRTWRRAPGRRTRRCRVQYRVAGVRPLQKFSSFFLCSRGIVTQMLR